MVGSDVQFVTLDRGGRMTRSLSHPYLDHSCLPLLRRWIREHLPAADDLVFRAGVVCTEVVADAVDHVGGGGDVRICPTPGGWLIEVDDTDPEGVLTPGRSRLGSNRGRGLTLISAFASWGVRRTRDGKTVWAVIDIAE
jgi:hypothetical protein